MEIYIKGLIESLKKDLICSVMEHKHGVMNEITQENVSHIFEGSLITLKKLGMITSMELDAEKYNFQDFVNTPYQQKAIHFLFSVKYDITSTPTPILEYKAYDVIHDSENSITLYQNVSATLEDVYSNGLLTFLLFNMPEADYKIYKYSSIEKLCQQEIGYFRDEEPLVITATSTDMANSIKCLSTGNYILQIIG